MNFSLTLILTAILSLAGITGSHPERHYKLLVFEGSDWCKNCIRLEEEVLSDTAFTAKLQEWNIELQRVDFPQRKKLAPEVQSLNDSLAGHYSFDGDFPTILLASSRTGHYRELIYQGPGDFVAALQSALHQLESVDD